MRCKILDLREVERPTKYGAAENPHFFAALDFLKRQIIWRYAERY